MSDLTLDQLSPGKPMRIEKDGKSICVTKIGDQVFAVDDTCTHSDASLSEGDITDFKIECWLHGAEFDLRNGQALTLPATQPLETYAVKIDGNSVTVEI